MFNKFCGCIYGSCLCESPPEKTNIEKMKSLIESIIDEQKEHEEEKNRLKDEIKELEKELNLQKKTNNTHKLEKLKFEHDDLLEGYKSIEKELKKVNTLVEKALIKKLGEKKFNRLRENLDDDEMLDYCLRECLNG